jgi:protein-disulfide isomerase
LSKSKSKNKEPLLSSNTIFVLSIIFGGLLLLTLLIYFGNKTEESNTPEITLNTTGQPTIGAEDAPIEVIEFFDFQCPACQFWGGEVFPTLKENYIDNDKVKFTSINFPFLGPDSERVALYFETLYHVSDSETAINFQKDVLNSIYVDKKETSVAFSDKNLMKIVSKMISEKEIVTINSAMKDKTYKKNVSEDKKMGMTSGVTGTPSIFINGKQFKDSLDPNLFFEEIDSILAE